MNARFPDRSECMELLAKCGAPEKVIAHSEAVADTAMELCALLPCADKELIRAAALLHDLFRTEPDHAERAYGYLNDAGWPLTAEAVRYHHDMRPGASLEAKVLYIADKLTQGTKRVTIDERFEASAKKCVTEEAKLAHTRRYEEARAVWAELFE